MTLKEGCDRITDLIVNIGQEDDVTSQVLFEHLIDYALEARDVRQCLIASDDRDPEIDEHLRLIIH